MNKEHDLLPWILGGLSAAIMAAAFAAVSSHRAVPVLPPTQVVAAQLATSPAPQLAPALAVAPAQTAQPVAESYPAAMPAPQMAGTVEPEGQSGQIWQCTTKGVKTFSNNPCGEKSTLLDVAPVNTMNPTPAIHYARAYGSEPRYAPGYADQSAGADAEDSDQYPAEAAGNSYTIIQGVRFVPRPRPEHSHRPPPAHHAPKPPGRQL